MNYIVFDLEWNQNPDGRKHPDSRLPFEIIEIGAVKLNEKREIIDTFQKPSADSWTGVERNIVFLPGEIRM